MSLPVRRYQDTIKHYCQNQIPGLPPYASYFRYQKYLQTYTPAKQVLRPNQNRAYMVLLWLHNVTLDERHSLRISAV